MTGSLLGTGVFSLPLQRGAADANPFAVVFVVFCWAMWFSAPGAWQRRRVAHFTPKNGLLIAVFAVTGIVGNYSICMALQSSSATLFSVLARTEIVVAMLLGWLLFKEYVTWVTWGAVGVIFAGIVVMRLESLTWAEDDWLPIFWALSTAFCFAWLQVLGKMVMNDVDPQILNVIRLSFGMGVLLLLPGVSTAVAAFSWETWGWLGLAAFAGPFAGRMCYTYALRYVSIATGMTVLTLAPVMTLLLEFAFLGRMLSPYELAGSAVVLLGILAAFRGQR